MLISLLYITWDKTELEFSHWDQSRRELELHTTRLLLSIHTVYTFNIQIRFKMTKIKDGSGFALFKHWASMKLLVHTMFIHAVYEVPYMIKMFGIMVVNELFSLGFNG